jgi:hypothetical protein
MALVGIAHTKQVLGDIQTISVELVKIFKGGIGFRSIPALLGLLDEVRRIATEAPKALPELKDIDAAEAGEISTQAYILVKALVDALGR